MVAAFDTVLFDLDDTLLDDDAAWRSGSALGREWSSDYRMAGSPREA